MMDRTGKFQSIKPKPSISGIISNIIFLIIFAVLASIISIVSVGLLTFLVIYIALSASVFFALIYFAMRYEIHDDYLLLKCGFFKWKIYYKEIEEIYIDNLRYHPTSTGWKLPGYALFKIYYSDKGNVTMCSTRMLHNILLIKTKEKLYGITPPNLNSFKQILAEKIK